MNTAAILRGPALVQWRGATIYHRDALTVPLEMSTFEIMAEPFGMVQARANQVNPQIQVTPSGRTAEVSNLINRYASSVPGELINVEEYPVSINTGTNVLTTSTAHLLTTGDEVMVHALITMPGGLSKTTRYFARAVTSTTLTLHATAADATNNANIIDITTTGSAVVLDVTRALTITTFNGLRIKYYNVALTGIPNLEFSAGRTMLGQASFTAFVRNGQDPDSAADRYYEVTAANPNDTSFDPADILTQHPVLTWAYDAAWTTLPTRDGAVAAFNLSTNPLPSDAFGEDALGRIFTDLGLTLTARPQGITEAEALAALQLHSAKRGDALSGGQLDVITDYYTFSLADAVLTSAPQTFSSTEQRMGEFVWTAQKTFTAGVKDPLFELTENA